MKKTAIAIAIAAACAAGCGGTNKEYVTPHRLERGLVIILPGIEGEGGYTYDVRAGLLRSAVDMAMPIHSWGRPIPLAGPLINQMDVIGNRIAARRIAQMVTDYQDSHPDRPVYIIGHSGGGGVAVFAAEALPDDRKLEGLILLSASISKTYNLTKALSRCRCGIMNFYSGQDVGLLGVGTTLFGNVDGIRGPSAGLTGFDKKPVGLYEIAWREEMAQTGYTGGHLSSGQEKFIAAYVAPFVLSEQWNIELLDRIPKREQAETAPSKPPLIKRQTQPTTAP